jgi:quercetin dioxygenase-like cupin family protein
VSIVEGDRFEAMVGDPDDHRPDTFWSLLVEPGGPEGRVDDFAVISERIAPGDRIPLHVHRDSEVVILHGDGRYRLGDQEHEVHDGAVVFIPAGVPHALANTGSEPLAIEGIVPTTRLWIRYLERNPAPGTERDAPQPPLTYDLRTGEITYDGG